VALQFEIIHKSSRSRARVGRIITSHGVIDTPGFVAVGTNGTIKALDTAAVSGTGLQLLFCNTYHLMLQPGSKVVAEAGGLHRFMGRNLPIITDSGGFQVFSLAYGGVTSELKSAGAKKQDGSVLKITEEGVLFRSYRDGNRFWLTPESSIAAQKDLGADIIIPFDELPPYHIDSVALRKSLDRTHRWEKRSLDEHLKNPNEQSIYAVVHGGVSEELRALSCQLLSDLPFDGYAIGGSVGKTREEMRGMLAFTLPRLPEEKPNHLLGIGDLTSLKMTLPLGVDTFDSSYPTRAARHGTAFTREGPLNLIRTAVATSWEPIDAACSCHTCRHHSRGYISHLFQAKEMAALFLTTLHNITYMVDLMASYRDQILRDEI